jgi:hypothetical protein
VSAYVRVVLYVVGFAELTVLAVTQIADTVTNSCCKLASFVIASKHSSAMPCTKRCVAHCLHSYFAVAVMFHHTATAAAVHTEGQSCQSLCLRKAAA